LAQVAKEKEEATQVCAKLKKPPSSK